MKHRRYFARLHGHQVSTDPIDDWLEYNETIEYADSSVQNQSTHSVYRKKSKVLEFTSKMLQKKWDFHLPADEQRW